jgi:hypothetical protein
MDPASSLSEGISRLSVDDLNRPPVASTTPSLASASGVLPLRTDNATVPDDKTLDKDVIRMFDPLWELNRTPDLSAMLFAIEWRRETCAL